MICCKIVSLRMNLIFVAQCAHFVKEHPICLWNWFSFVFIFLPVRPLVHLLRINQIMLPCTEWKKPNENWCFIEWNVFLVVRYHFFLSLFAPLIIITLQYSVCWTELTKKRTTTQWKTVQKKRWKTVTTKWNIQCKYSKWHVLAEMQKKMSLKTVQLH